MLLIQIISLYLLWKEKKDPFKFPIALLTPKKGMDILIRAFYEAFRDVEEVVLEIGGDGPSRPIRKLSKRTKNGGKDKVFGNVG